MRRTATYYRRVSTLPVVVACSGAPQARDREILRRKKTGESYRSIATDMNLSLGRVGQIVKRGLTLLQRAGPGAEPRRQIRGPWHDLTPRERNVALLDRNISNDEIARELGIKPGTVKIHVHNILIKLGSRDGGLRRRTGRSSKGATTTAGIERCREAVRRRWQHRHAARSADNT